MQSRARGLTNRNSIYRTTGRMYNETRALARRNARNYFRRRSSGGMGG